MNPSLPALVTRLADRRTLTELVRAALRHDIAGVQLAEGPTSTAPHTLDLHVAGSRAVSLLAEPAGAPEGGRFPLRLRPLHRAQAAELYALLDAEGQGAPALGDPAPGAEPFFDDALLNLPPLEVADEDAPLPTGGDDAPWDDDLETLVRVPTAPPSDCAIISVAPTAHAASEGLTPTAVHDPPGATALTGGRWKKTTRKGSRTTRRSPREGEPDGAEAPSSGRLAGGEVLLGRRIADGKYAIESLIGSGAAGAVYKATHRELRRPVAIKVLHPHYQEDPQFMKSFRGEALAASQLDHPNVMRVLDFGQEPDGLLYIVMEHLSGRTLQSLLDEEQRLPPERAVEIMIQVCAALSVAHDKQIIHRDIKPDNIILVPSRNDEGGTFELVKVCDFGIAALQNARAEDDDLAMVDGTIAGTPEYMSPEQARGAEIDARSDVYACGICLYELVTGRPPFLGENPAAVLLKQLEEAPRPPSALVKGLDPLLEEIVLRAIQKDPGSRQQSARELRVELKELIDPVDAGTGADDDERSIVESVPGLDDPASGFAGFFMALSSAVLRVDAFERGHPDAAQAMKDLLKATRAALRGRIELTFARRDTSRGVGYVVMSGHAEILDLKRLLGAQLHGSHGERFIGVLVAKGIASLTLREGLPEGELTYLVDMLIGGLSREALRKDVFARSPRAVSVLFASDVLGRERKLSWKVGLCASRLARDLHALSSVRGISLKKMRETREDLVAGVAHLLTKGEEVRQLLYNADLVDEAVANLRGFSSFKTGPVVVERLLHEPCAQAVMLVLSDFDAGERDRDVLRGYLRLFVDRLVTERSPSSDAALTELHKRSLVADDEMPRDLKELIRADLLADALVREPSHVLSTLEHLHTPDDYARELQALEPAMKVLARRAEAAALLATMTTLARHAEAGGPRPGPRESHALATMKSMLDKERLLPVATALLTGPRHQLEAARKLLLLAGSAGAHALYAAREATTAEAVARATFVQVLREAGPAGWSLLSTVLPRLEVHTDAQIALVEDLLRALPDHLDPALGEAAARYLLHPRLRPTALAAIVPLWGERARKPLVDALEFAEEPARIVAITELRRLRAIDEQVVTIVERLLTMRGSASEELRAVAAAALADAAGAVRLRVVSFLAKGIEGKRGFFASLRGADGGSDETVLVTEAMARSLVQLDRAEAVRVIRARLARSDGPMRSRLVVVLQQT